MPENPLAALPEVFVSNSNISKTVFDALKRGELRKLGSRLYTRNLDADPETLIRRNWYFLVPAYYPDAIIADRTALENKPAPDGSVFLISSKARDVELPGLILRPRKGPGPLPSDKKFIGGALLSSMPRAYLENMSPSRARRERVARTLASGEIEQRLDARLRQQGEEALNRLRDDAQAIASGLGLDKEYEELNRLIGALPGTRNAKLEHGLVVSRATSQP